MKRYLIATLMVLFGIGFVLGDTQSVFAQGDEIDEFTLEEITVTAQKREEDLQKVPVAIETISGVELSEWGRTDFSDAFSGITTVKIQQTTRGYIISMRGMSDDQGGQNSPVTVNIDGDYTRRQEVGLMGLLDMERIEVLNGPQGVLYGRLATGGAINLVTADPTERFEANGLVEYGSYSLMRTQGVLNVPVNEKWALRAAFQTVLRDGYMDNGEMDADEKSGRIKAKFTPNDDITVVLTGEKSKTGGVGTGDVLPFVDQPANAWVSAYAKRNDTYKRYGSDRYAGNMDWNLGLGVWTLRYSSHETINDWQWILMEALQERYENTRENAWETRFASQDDAKIKWMMGLYYYKRKDMVEAYIEEYDRYQFDAKTAESKAGFASATYPITNQFRVNGGIRYTRDVDKAIASSAAGSYWTDTIYSNTDYKIGVEYDLNESSMLWADFSTGFRAGIRGGPPEYLDAYQLGAKHRFLDDALQLNYSAYYYDYQDYQSGGMKILPEFFVFDSGTGVGDAQISGIDVQASWIISSHDRFDFNVSYLASMYEDVVIDWEYSADEPLTGLTKTHSPEWTFSPTYEHVFYLQNGGALMAHVDTTYRGKVKLANFIDPSHGNPDGVYEMKAHWLSNASLTYNSPEGRWSLSGYVKNIENVAVKNSCAQGKNQIGPPRTWAINLSVRY